MTDFIAWHGRGLVEHLNLRDKAKAGGYRFVSLSIYGRPSEPFYAAVMVRRPVVHEQRDWAYLSEAQLDALIASQALDQFGPIIISATTAGSAGPDHEGIPIPLYAAVFEAQSPLPVTGVGLTSGATTIPTLKGPIPNTKTIQGMNYQALQSKRVLRWAASYGGAFGPTFAGIWVPNRGDAGDVLWSNEGIVDDVGRYQARFEAQTAAWCRPSFVTLDAENRYLSLFVADEIGGFVAAHDMSPADYQDLFDKCTTEGLFPICVQAAGDSAEAARFAAVFVPSEQITPKVLTTTGTVEHPKIDADMETFIATHPVARHAALAIVHESRLVYARGYTNAEADWPIVQPTTYFRLASVSKLITALAVFQLIERGELSLSDRLQDILQLSSIGGGPPSDARFNDITVQHLLEHTSGLRTDVPLGSDVVTSYNAAGHAANLPVSEAMIDDFVASQDLVSDPGAVEVYSNCGYYLLGRIVARLRGTESPIGAYLTYLLNPLGLSRIRASTDLVIDQPADEARYQAAGIDTSAPSDLQVDVSQMTPAQPLVAVGYGTDQLAVSQGSGGLSAAAVDLAMLAAMLMCERDTPAMKRTTIEEMLSRAASRRASGFDRAGYGFDDARTQAAGQFSAVKGGLLRNASSELVLDRQWGWVGLWGGPTESSPGISSREYGYIADFAVLAELHERWPRTDLFPCFGIRSIMPAAIGAASGVAGRTAAFLVGTDGRLNVFESSGPSSWAGPQLPGSPAQPGAADLIAPTGAGIAVCQHVDLPPRTDVFVVDADGVLTGFWADAAGKWSGPEPISGVGFAPHGAAVAAQPHYGLPGRIDVFVVNSDGRLAVFTGELAGGWTVPIQYVTEVGFAPPGSPISVSAHFGVQGRTDVFVVGNDGSLWGFWTTGGGDWSEAGVSPISNPGIALPGASVAASQHFGVADQTDVFVIDTHGELRVFSSDASGRWTNSPPDITYTGFASPGAEIAVCQHFGTPDRTDLYVVDASGNLLVRWTQGGKLWEPWSLGTNLGVVGYQVASPGAAVAACQNLDPGSLTVVFVVGKDGELLAFSANTAGGWSSARVGAAT
jgi:CubicO group peptidase (beta-lactamase class C family)